MALNPNTIKALFSKLAPYADDAAEGVTKYGDDAARLVANYGDDALAVANEVDDLPFVGVRADVRNRHSTGYDIGGPDGGPYEMDAVSVDRHWFEYPPDSEIYGRHHYLRGLKHDLLRDFLDGTRRYDSPTKTPSAISKALKTSPDSMTPYYKSLLESNPHLKKLYSKLNPQYDWNTVPRDPESLPF